MPFLPARPVRPLRWRRIWRLDGKIGVDDEAEVGKIEPPRGDVGGDAHPGAAIAQGLQRIGALSLAHLAG